MFSLNNYQILFFITAFLFQVILLVHFALRKWRFDLAIRYGWIVYMLSIPAAILSVILLRGGMGWSFALGGFIYLAWAAFGFVVEYIFKIEWRNSLRWSILIPFVVLYLAAVMFYWWPLALIYKPLWYVYAVIFTISTYLNVTSHHKESQLHTGEGRIAI
jgi:hypothetical protein